MLYEQDKDVIVGRLKILRFRSLNSYYGSTAWAKNRKRFLQTKCFCCQRKKKRMNLHHMTYVRLGEEIESDVCWLCQDCHKTVHLYYMTLITRPWSEDLLTYATCYVAADLKMQRDDRRKKSAEYRRSRPKRVFEKFGIVRPLEKVNGGLTVSIVERPTRFAA